jgi:aldose 1-epimerase
VVGDDGGARRIDHPLPQPPARAGSDSGNQLDGILVGPGGAAYRPGPGWPWRTQHFPDTPNQPGFPSTVLRPGQVYQSATVYRFSVSG